MKSEHFFVAVALLAMALFVGLSDFTTAVQTQGVPADDLPTELRPINSANFLYFKDYREGPRCVQFPAECENLLVDVGGGGHDFNPYWLGDPVIYEYTVPVGWVVEVYSFFSCDDGPSTNEELWTIELYDQPTDTWREVNTFNAGGTRNMPPGMLITQGKTFRFRTEASSASNNLLNKGLVCVQKEDWNPNP